MLCRDLCLKLSLICVYELSTYRYVEFEVYVERYYHKLFYVWKVELKLLLYFDY